MQKPKLNNIDTLHIVRIFLKKNPYKIDIQMKNIKLKKQCESGHISLFLAQTYHNVRTKNR